MPDPTLLLIVLAAGTLAVAVTAFTALRVWRDWLELRRTRIGRAPATAAGLELAELKQRIRRLESIADGEG